MFEDAPFTAKLVSVDNHYEIHISFKSSFIAMDNDARKKYFSVYMGNLQQQLLSPLDDSEKQGMMTVLQFCQSIFPHLSNDEISLDDTMIFEMVPDNPIENLLSESKLD